METIVGLERPDWKNINDPKTSHVGWVDGKALSADSKKSLDAFIADLASGSFNLLPDRSSIKMVKSSSRQVQLPTTRPCGTPNNC